MQIENAIQKHKNHLLNRWTCFALDLLAEFSCICKHYTLHINIKYIVYEYTIPQTVYQHLERILTFQFCKWHKHTPRILHFSVALLAINSLIHLCVSILIFISVRFKSTHFIKCAQTEEVEQKNIEVNILIFIITSDKIKSV